MPKPGAEIVNSEHHRFSKTPLTAFLGVMVLVVIGSTTEMETEWVHISVEGFDSEANELIGIVNGEYKFADKGERVRFKREMVCGIQD